MTFKSRLYNINKDLENSKRERHEILSESIEDRLNNALESYIKEIYESFDYLQYRDDIRVMQKLNKRKD